jgi:hypothetical protein
VRRFRPPGAAAQLFRWAAEVLLVKQEKPMKKEICLVVLIVVLSACADQAVTPTTAPSTRAATTLTPLPTPSAQLILNPDWAIAYSYEILVHRELEPGFSYESSTFAEVQFPSGSKGVFVAIGFTGVARGYQFLYRIDGNQVELVELSTWPPGTVWGLRSLQPTQESSAQVEIEFLNLFASDGNPPRQIIKLTGARHAGTGLWDDGCFEIIEITDEGLKGIFSGVEARINMTNSETRCQYQYIDLDSDGNKEITEECEHCEYRYDPDTWEKEDLGCEVSHTVYRYDGTRYVPR